MRSNYLKYIILSLILSCISLLTLLNFFDRFENQIYDYRFKQKYYGKTEEGSLSDVVIVDIDSRSSQKLGKYFEWPRSYFASAVDALSDSKAEFISFDILFDRSSYAEQDSILIESIKSAGNVITGYNFEYEDKENFIYADSTDNKLSNAFAVISTSNFEADEFDILNVGSENILNSSLANGFLGIDSDEDGVIRKVQLFKKYKGKYYASSAFATCMKLLKVDPESIKLSDGKAIIFKSGIDDKEIKIPLTESNSMLIHYKGPWRTYKTISFYDVMEKRVGKKAFRDKPVLIGSSLRGLMDLRSTPIQKHFPGVEVQANIIQTILNGDFINKSGRATTFIIMLLIIIFTAGIILTRLNMIISTIVIILTGYLYYKLTGKLFDSENYILDTTRPIFSMIFTFLTTYTLNYYKENKAKKFIRATLGKYVPEIVSKEILKNPDKYKLGGEKKEITMMFSDIRSFTAYSEKTDPKELVGFLNIYLKRMTGVIKQNQGTLDKYMGDAVICFFGAPLDMDHPYYACKSALEMMIELKKLKNELENDTFKNIDIGIGINTDLITVGNIGSEDLFDYTAIGDGMNLASRLEGLNKYYG
ncbi:MAG: adenylate/guanylate cyclase domain-containing protein, partial [Candidatus Delongbacteria bacterium]|nr:adenylate/guanylate cyclase domain-containing protein [Candidatus Delongbacteria bacterium]MCG2760097.1 adenylate/guanylate cyclase domain-containing protein [Candidatus Delongbacteria bacterium]